MRNILDLIDDFMFDYGDYVFMVLGLIFFSSFIVFADEILKYLLKYSKWIFSQGKFLQFVITFISLSLCIGTFILFTNIRDRWNSYF